jgi:TRAP-type mannitol/chloroaromatic compound transport system permease large subunit
MEDITTTLTEFLATPSGLAIKALMVGTFLTFVLGVVAAFRDKTFSFVYIDSFVRSTLMGRVVPASIVLIVGYIGDDQTLLAAGIIVSGAVAAGMVASAIDSIRQLALPREDSAVVNKTPTA